jgi:tetratricopeptide (TPR) repeat protein
MVDINIEQTMTLAIQHHQAGRLQEAEQLYRQILARQPGHVIAMHHLGMIAHQVGRNDIAVDLLRHVITLNPNLPEAHSNLGNVLRIKWQLDDAITACRQAIVLRPNYAEAYNNLGLALKDNGQLDEAIAAYHQAIALKPNYAEAHNNLGIALMDKGHFDEAIAAFRQTLVLRPNFSEAHNNLGNALKKKGQINDAIAAYHQAIAHRPNYAKAYNNLGVALTDKGELDAAITACRQAIALNPNFAEAHNNFGSALQYNGQLDEAIAAYRKSITLEPNYAETHYNLARALLTRGDLAAGWDEFEWRLKIPSLGLNRDLAQPQWDGAEIAGKTLLIHTEGGFGDALHFARYIPMLRQTGAAKAHLLLECQAPLAPLLGELSGVDRIICRGDPLPPFDVHISFQSLPRIFHTDLTNIPHAVPYIRVPADRRLRWADRLPRDEKLNVGLSWAGSNSPPRDIDRRTRTLACLAPLARAVKVRFVGLQKGPEAAEARPLGMEVLDFSDDLCDFADTAALVENLDLVISVDSSVAHLAGALAKPVWVLITLVPDFRWMLDRRDSPWYPTMRLFRQETPGDWQIPIQKLAEELCRFATAK